MNYLNNKKEIIIYPWLKNIKTITVAKFVFILSMHGQEQKTIINKIIQFKKK